VRHKAEINKIKAHVKIYNIVFVVKNSKGDAKKMKDLM
jgi:hypothetical protein